MSKKEELTESELDTVSGGARRARPKDKEMAKRPGVEKLKTSRADEKLRIARAKQPERRAKVPVRAKTPDRAKQRTMNKLKR